MYWGCMGSSDEGWCGCTEGAWAVVMVVGEGVSWRSVSFNYIHWINSLKIERV